MEYKISEIVTKTDVPKSTILYYIREGLLPQAKKIKSNVHRYNDEHIELIKYIKYMKQDLGSSNEQIKAAIEKKNQSFASSFSMLAPLMQTLSDISPDDKHYTKKEFLVHFKIKESLLEELLKDEIILPLNPDDFTEKEASIVDLIEQFKEVGVEYEIIKEYVIHAKKLSILERDIQAKLCAHRTDNNFSTLWKIMFETLFNAKKYIFCRHTHKLLFEMLKKEMKREN